MAEKSEEKYPVPEHLDSQTRNDRLYKTLLSLGLYVEPVFKDDTRSEISYMRVSVDRPR
jgi:hypothetical protein